MATVTTFSVGLATTMTLNGIATIDNGETATLAIPNAGRAVVRLAFPAAMTGTTITFTAQAYPASGTLAATTFKQVVDKDGDAVSYTIAASKIVEVPELSGVAAFTIVSGSAEGAARSIEVSSRGDNPTAVPTKIEAALTSGTVAVGPSVVPGTGATNLGKAEDQAAVDGDVGVGALRIRANTPAATAANGDYEFGLVDTNGADWASLATLIAGESQTLNRLMTAPSYSFLNITTNATTTVKSGAGIFHGFTVNNNGFTTAGTITIYDNTAGSGTKIGTYTIPLEPPGSVLLATVFVPPQLGLDAAFATGLTIVTATTAPAADITVLYI